MDMIKIPGGNFLMGSHDFGPYESPVHSITISDFYLDPTLVTNAQFAQFVSETKFISQAERTGAAWGYDHSGVYKNIPALNWNSFNTPERKDHPVVLVSWEDANAYATWANKRLPTEAEWEYAARAGMSSKLYPWGDDEANGTQSNFSRSPAYLPPTTSVNAFLPNAFGIYDIVGNVWQWCADWFDENYYNTSPAINPQGPAAGTTKVRRGGSWNVIQPFRLRCANRGAMLKETVAPNIGFRCARSC